LPVLYKKCSICVYVNNGILISPRLKKKYGTCRTNLRYLQGLWDCEKVAESPITEKSEIGYVIIYDGCPIIWESQLQSEFAMSMTEAEDLALSTALQYIPLLSLVEEIKKNLQLPMDFIPKVI
jgi:hypothetical protein